MLPHAQPDERPVSEGDLQAYTDGSLAGERAVRVRRYLAARPGEWHRILFYRRLNAQIRSSFGHDEAGSVARPLGPQQPQRPHTSAPRGSVRRWASALAMAGVLVAAAVAWLSVSEPSAQVVNDAAVMALMEAGGVSMEMPTGHGGPDALAAPLADSLAQIAPADVPAPFDLAPAGLRLVSAGTVELGPFARVRRWVYENAEGKPVVLLASRAWFAQTEPQWGARRVGNLRLIGWTEGGERWVLAGNAQTRGLMRAADVATQDETARAGAAGGAEPQR
jgi:anti-sigma factor RsiW